VASAAERMVWKAAEGPTRASRSHRGRL